jgi:hypothetical protein
MNTLSDNELAMFLIQSNSIYQVKTFINNAGNPISINSVDEIYVEMSKRSTKYWENKIREYTNVKFDTIK